MEEDGTSERAGLGFQPPAQAGYSVDPHAAMADAPALSTPPVRNQVPEPPRSQWRNLHPRHLHCRASRGPRGRPSIPMPIRFTPVSDPANHVRFDMFPDTFPAIPGHLAGLLVLCTEKEMVQLFDQFTGYPLTTPVVTRIIEQYIPAGPGYAGEGLDTEVSEGLRH